MKLSQPKRELLYIYVIVDLANFINLLLERFDNIKNMNYTPILTRTSLLELARSGDFQAISHWMNKKLKPQGISARITKETTGYLKILVEFQREPSVDRLIKFICHQLCKLNSPVLERVNIVGRLSGSSKILWKHSVRINQQALYI